MAGRLHIESLTRVAVASLCALAGCAAHKDAPDREAPASSAAASVSIAPRQPLIPTYPCSRCHAERTPDPRRRTFTEFHTTRNAFKHGDSERWCYQCHSLVDIDRLVIANGSLVTFDQGYLVCGSCHGDKLRDWKLQVHGATQGYWNGPKIRPSCPACHNPHGPRFPPVVPEAPPTPPETVD
jgi:hypothetical protein